MLNLLHSVRATLKKSPLVSKKRKAPTRSIQGDDVPKFSLVNTQEDDEPKTPLLKLPVELIFLICEHLAGPDMLSFLHNSHWLLSVYQNRPSALTVSTEDRELFHQTWAKTMFPRQAAIEMHDDGHHLATTEQLLCVFCLVRHPSFDFGLTERGKVPFKRRCIGSTRKLRICAQHSITLSELQKHTTRYKRWSHYSCGCRRPLTTWRFEPDGRVSSSMLSSSSYLQISPGETQ
jgi:hypothetical protein